MRVVVYPHDLGLGGSQLNAVELAGAVRDLGHDVVVYGRPGALVGRVEQLGLEFVPSPPPGRRPSARVVTDLRRLVRRRGVDVVHGYEWPPILEARMAALGADVAAVGTVMSMAVAPFIPRRVPLVVGTAQIGAAERQRGRAHVTVIEPPIDLQDNRIDAPELADDVPAFARRYGVDTRRPVVVVVTRLARELKLEGLLTAVRTVPDLHGAPTLVVVGDGPERQAVAAAADDANRAAGREAVVLTGPLDDPRPAYAVADVVLGMGGSVLRAMAFGKPVVVQGEGGFWSRLTPDTLDRFRWEGWYGVGPDPVLGSDALRAQLQPLLHDEQARVAAGEYAREVVQAHGLVAAAERQAQEYERAVTARAGRRLDLVGDTTGAARLVTHVAGRHVQRLRGRASTDDFNARPVAAEPRTPQGAAR
ncbi:glycosyltransferase [Terracoccus luteus]|uniref:D-inositol 3-phosphate glycosyltransferase n=1 Tax=Terracoccus luteus TaxID=53356 RepID=A0A839PNF0_9MICO|nr:glycosyltransferase [Terracoccus luteus]MBB2985740.1 glycosyltransferase involved in cell wall biosynthesis [Terracoccus luteus]MCP2171392.1 glycosyltransferase involved in cell wall biosynthesis [Terracoccus luteus]